MVAILMWNPFGFRTKHIFTSPVLWISKIYFFGERNPPPQYICTIIIAFVKSQGMDRHIFEMSHLAIFSIPYNNCSMISGRFTWLCGHTQYLRIHVVYRGLCKMVPIPHRMVKILDFLQEHFDDLVIVLHFVNHTGIGMDSSPHICLV